MNIDLLWALLILLFIGSVYSIFEVWRYARHIRQHLKVKIGEEVQVADDKDEEARILMLSIQKLILSAKYDETASNIEKTSKINIENPVNINEHISNYGSSDAAASDNFYRPNKGYLRRIK